MKVIKSGHYSDWGKPPAGIKIICHYCKAELKTEEDEPEAAPTIQGTGARGKIREGWHIPCPECRRSVFVEKALAKMLA